MSTKANPAVIGFFVLSAIFVGIASVLILGGGELTADKIIYVAYFDESLKGLDVGAPVTFKGVAVGAVTNISIITDIEEFAMKMPVVFEVDRKGFTFVKDGVPVKARESLQQRENAKILIDRGLRARLQTQSFVTGKKEIALDFFPDTPVMLTGESPEYVELPTIPSAGEKLARTLQDIQLDKIADEILKTFEGLRKIIEDPRIGRILDEIEGTVGDFGELARDLDESVAVLAEEAHGALGEARDLIRDVDEQVSPVSANLGKTLDTARAALEKATGTLSEAEEILSEDSPLQQELLSAMREISGAARSLRMLVEYLERHPEALIQGKGGD